MNLQVMSRQQLIDYAAKKGFVLDPKYDKAKMIELIKGTEQKVKSEAITATEKTIAKWCRKKKDTTMTVRFQNLDSPGAEHEFTLSEGTKQASHICPKCKQKFLVGKDEKLPHCERCSVDAVEKVIVKDDDYHFHFYDREIYDMPTKIITYLNGLQTRDDTFKQDPVTGMGRAVKGFRNRFACIPIDLGVAASA